MWLQHSLNMQIREASCRPGRAGQFPKAAPYPSLHWCHPKLITPDKVERNADVMSSHHKHWMQVEEVRVSNLRVRISKEYALLFEVLWEVGRIHVYHRIWGLKRWRWLAWWHSEWLTPWSLRCGYQSQRLQPEDQNMNPRTGFKSTRSLDSVSEFSWNYIRTSEISECRK
jgi:hypothetical protein